jgi:hypothetical protein
MCIPILSSNRLNDFFHQVLTAPIEFDLDTVKMLMNIFVHIFSHPVLCDVEQLRRILIAADPLDSQVMLHSTLAYNWYY